MDVEATRARRGEEVASTKTMIERVENRFQLKPERLAADTAYGNAQMLGWLVEDKGIEPHIPVWDKSERRPTGLVALILCGWQLRKAMSVQGASA